MEENKLQVWPIAVFFIILVTAAFLKVQQTFFNDQSTGEAETSSAAGTSSTESLVTMSTDKVDGESPSNISATSSANLDKGNESEENKNTFEYQNATITVAGKQLNVLLSDSVEKRFKGLSDRKNLDEVDGMLFIFFAEGRYTFVMRDMLFPLDLLWFNQNEVVHIVENANPEPERSEGQLTTYTNEIPASAVLEVPAGFVKNHNIKIGDRVVY